LIVDLEIDQFLLVPVLKLFGFVDHFVGYFVYFGFEVLALDLDFIANIREILQVEQLDLGLLLLELSVQVVYLIVQLFHFGFQMPFFVGEVAAGLDQIPRQLVLLEAFLGYFVLVFAEEAHDGVVVVGFVYLVVDVRRA
jgi:hypothetical protein